MSSQQKRKQSVGLAGLAARSSAGDEVTCLKCPLLSIELADGSEWRFLRANVGAKPTVEADAGWRRKNDIHSDLEPPDGGCRSGSAP